MWDDDTEYFDLAGDLHYDTLISTNNLRSAYWFRKNCQKGNFYMVRPRGQYLHATGKTLFKGMGFDDVKRMYFDLETYTTKGYKFSNPSRVGDKITLIPIKLNQGKNNKIILINDEDGWSKVEYEVLSPREKITNAELLQDHFPDTQFIFCENEEQLLEAFFIIVEETNPDVFVNHNIFNFDLEFIYERCRLHDIRMKMSRDGSAPNRYETVTYIADKTLDIINYEFYGRHVIDTMIQARQVDAGKRGFENYQLKYLVKAIGKERKGRIIVPGHRIADVWDNNDSEYSRFDLISYALDDVEDAQTLDRTFGSGTFESTKFTPYPYQDVFRLATGGKSETLFVRYYLQHGHSLPKPDKARKYGGGLSVSRMKELGIQVKYGLVLKENILIDVKSLYPTIGIEENIQPKDDVLGFYQKIIGLFRQFRYDIKDQIPDATPEEQERLKAADFGIKPYLNTIAYGYLGSAHSLFNDYDEAERITIKGQEVLADMVRVIEAEGGQFIRGDTDGAIAIPPSRYRGSFEKNMEFVELINKQIPKYEIGLDGRYQSILVVDGKSYALKDYEDNVIIKGDTLKSRSKENFILAHLKEIITKLLDGNMDVLEESFFRWDNMIKHKKLDKEDVLQYSEIKEPLQTYRTKVELGSGNGGRNADAAYELACQLEYAGNEVRVGDRIEYYVAESPKTVVINGRNRKPKIKDKYSKVFELAKNIDDFEPGTTNVKHYKKRLRDSSEPIYMLFYSLEYLKEKYGFSMHKNRREKLAEIEENIYNETITAEDEAPF